MSGMDRLTLTQYSKAWQAETLIKALDYQSLACEWHADGGDWSLEFTLRADNATIDDWMDDGLGRYISLRNPYDQEVWGGFTNQVSAQRGWKTITRGPLVNVRNRLKNVFAELDTSTGTAVVSGKNKTVVYNDTASQALYGIVEKALNCSDITEAEAAPIVNTYLAENAYPETSEQISFGGGGVNLKITCAGMYHWLALYLYNLASSALVNLSDKIIAVLAGNPNTLLFSSDVSEIASNTIQVNAWESEDKSGQDIIKGLVGAGGTAYARMLFGFRGRKAYYRAVPSTVKYLYREGDYRLGLLLLDNQSLIKPWDIEIGNWMTGTTTSPNVSAAAVRGDAGNQFIESVKFTAPAGLDINGKKVKKLPQLLARMGIGGMG